VIGFFPADSPKFLVMVKLNEPEVRPWGSDTAGPVFFSILRDLVAYYGLTP
jgi:cell division protein FtsI (penicillin-binding protein 3)